MRKRPPSSARGLDEMSPREIVAELDRYVVGQHEAKKAVAIALRNRVRRQKLDPEMAEEVAPKNIIMIGPTGVGKTEIARRLARLANSPFLKIEATKYTEVGYVGRDVESMIRDLVEIAVDMVRMERLTEVAETAERERRRAGARPAAGRRSSRPRGKAVPAMPARISTWWNARATSCASSCVPASWIAARRSKWKCASTPMSPFAFQVFEGASMEEIQFNMKDMLCRHDGRQTQETPHAGRRGPGLPRAGRRAEAGRHGTGRADRPGSRRGQAASSSLMKSTRSPGARAGMVRM